MSEFVEIFGQYTVGEVVVFLMAVGFVIGVITYAYKIAVKFNKWFEKRDEKLDELTTIIKEHDKTLDDIKTQMSNYYELSKCMASDRLNQKISFYHSINGIPSEEFEEFRYFGDVAKQCKINHGLGNKIDLCIERLPIIYSSNEKTSDK